MNVSRNGIVAVVVVIICFIIMGFIEAKADYVDRDSSSQTTTITDSGGDTSTCVMSCVEGGGCYLNCY
jgi:hypothetical protein